jgi:hypothetical protein
MTTDLGTIPKVERFGLVPAFVLADSTVKPNPKALYASPHERGQPQARVAIIPQTRG